MLEAGYQNKIIKHIELIGGIAINGSYSKAGIADLICGWPHYEEKVRWQQSVLTLIHLHVEVKTEKDYHRVMKAVTEVEGFYVIDEDSKALKPHEYLQITKLNIVRERGGKGLIAWNFEQVREYMDA